MKHKKNKAFLDQGQIPDALAQNYFGNDVSEISSNSQQNASNKNQLSQVLKRRQTRKSRKENLDDDVQEENKQPEKLKEENLRPPDREENGNFELFWQVIRKQEEPPYQSSIDETISEEIDLEEIDPNAPILLEMDQLKQVKLKEGLHELVDDHYDEYERTFDDPEEMANQSQEQEQESQPETLQQVSSTLPDQNDTTSEWIQGKYIQYDLQKSLVKTKTGGITWYNPLSFNRWTLESKLRQACIALNEWIWFERIILFFIIINSILLGTYDYLYFSGSGKQKPIMNTVGENAEIIFTLIYCFECVVKLIALGIIEGRGCYFRLGWNVIDFSVVVIGFVNMTPQFTNLQPLRAFRMLRPLRIAKQMPAMQVLVPTITGCLQQLAAFWLYLIFYIFVFSLFGLQLFSGITHNRCRLTPKPDQGDWKLAPGPPINCGGFQQCNSGYTCGSLLDPSIRSQLWALKDSDLYRDTLNPDFNWGVSNFDNIYSSMIAVFQCLTLEGQFDLMNQAINGYNYYIGFIYYLLMFLVIFQFLLNLSVAIMVGTIYQKDNPEIERDTQNMLELRDKFDRVKEIIGVRSLKPKSDQKAIYQFLAWAINGLLQYQPGEPANEPRYKYKIIREIWSLVEQPSFKLFYLILLLLNLLLLNKFGGPSKENGGLGSFAIQLTIIIVINVFFALEIVIKLIAYTLKEFAESSMNFLEITIVGVFFLTYIVDCIKAKELIFMQSWKLEMTQSLIGFNTLRGVRLFSTYLSLRQTRNVVFVMVACLSKVWNYLIPVVIFIYVFTLFGMDIFAGRLYFDQHHNSIPQFANLDSYRGVYHPRGNFDNLLNAGIAVFQTFVGDQWQTIFFDCVRGAGYRRSVLYWFFLISLGNILLMRFTISFVLWSFKKATMRLNIDHKNDLLKRVVAPTLMDRPEKLTCPVLQDHQNDDYTISQQDVTKQESQISTERSQINKKTTQYDKSPNLDFLGNSMSDNQILDDLNSAQLSLKQKKSFTGSINLRTVGKDSNLKGYEADSRAVKFDMEAGLSAIDFKLPSGGNRSSRNNVNNPVVGRAQTMQAMKLQNSNTMIEKNIVNDNSFITEDIQAKDEDNEQEEPFPELPTKKENKPPQKGESVKQLKSDFRKLSALPKELTADNWSKMGSDLPLEKSSKIKDKSKSNLQSQKGQTIKQGESQLLDDITVWYVKPLVEKKVVVKTDDDEEDLGKFKQQKAFDWREHMRLSSLFIFHRDSEKRKFADRIAFGGEELRFFKGAQVLVDFYKRKPKTLEEIFQEAERRKKDDRFIIADKSLDSFEAIQLQFEPEGQKELPITAQTVVKEIWRIRKHEKFNIKELYDQSILIDQVRQDRDKNRSFKQNLLANRERFFVDSETNQIKMYCVPWYKPTGYQILQFFVQISIYVSVGTLMFEDPLATKITTASLVITLTDFLCQLIFAYEASVKIIALGFLYNDLEDTTKIPYIKNMWNALEFLVLLVSWVFLIESNYANLMGTEKLTEKLGVIRTLRMIRLLKPLCQKTEMKKLKIACFCLIGSLNEMMTQILMVGTFILIFSISGQAFFANQFWQCVINDNFDIARTDPRIITKEDCLNLGYRWENPNINFDTIQTSMMGLFQLLLCSGWIETLRNGIDSVGVGMQPKENNKIYLIVYFVFYVIVARLLLTNMFSAILINSMNNVRDRIDGFSEIYKIQRRWVNVQRLMIQFGPKKFYPTPTNFLGSRLAKLIKNKRYEQFFMLVMITNALALCFKFIGAPSLYLTIVNYSSYFFLALYNFDLLVKWIGLGNKYFTKVWNIFDFSIILIADGCLALEFGMNYVNLVNAVLALRLFKLVTIFKLAKKHEEFRVVYRTMYIVLVQFMYVLLLQFFTIFIFAVVGMGFYSKVMLQNSYNNIANFRSFQNALILLICCLMGKTWKDVMYELTLQGKYNGVQCEVHVTDDMLAKGIVNGCGHYSAYFYFLIYILTTRMQFLNLFVSFTIDIYMSCCADETEVIKEKDCKLFIKQWQYWDPNATCWIEPSDIPYLVYDLEGQLGKKDEYLSRIDDAIKNSDDIESRTKYFYLGSKQMLMPKHFAQQLIEELNLPVYQTATGDRCHFKDLAIALLKSRLGQEFKTATSLVIMSWSDEYNILARPKENLNESTQISRINQSTDKDDKQQNQYAANLPTENQRIDTERGLLEGQHLNMQRMVTGNQLIQKKSSLRKSRPDPNEIKRQISVRIATPERR